MTREEMLARTKRFALGILQLSESIPDTRAGRVIANQIIRSGTSVGANYRSACRPKSDKDFINKMVILEEEADETAFWLELLRESKMMNPEAVHALRQEAGELTAIFVASAKTVRERIARDKQRGS